MKTLSTLILIVLLCPAACFADDMFGLGDAGVAEASVVSSAETFGLSNDPTPAVRYESQLANVLPRKSTATERPSVVVRTVEVKKPARIQIVRRALSEWTINSVSWTVGSLRSHLLGSNHQIPVEQLDGRALSELRAIHDNLHEGWAWDGSSRIRSVVVSGNQEIVRSRTVTRQSLINQSCPGGRCPTNQSYGRRLFRR